MAAHGILLVLCDTVDGADEDAFNRWYTEEHAPDIIRRGAAVRCRRYAATDVPLRAGLPFTQTYAAVYEIAAETVEDVRAIEARLRESATAGRSGTSPGLDLGSLRASFMLPVSGEITAS